MLTADLVELNGTITLTDSEDDSDNTPLSPRADLPSTANGPLPPPLSPHLQQHHEGLPSIRTLSSLLASSSPLPLLASILSDGSPRQSISSVSSITNDLLHASIDSPIKSRRGKRVAWVVFRGHRVGVFTNWYVIMPFLCTSLPYLLFRGLVTDSFSGFPNQSYRGYESVQEAQTA